MLYQVGLENGDENRSVAWVLGHPGCFAYGPEPEPALQAAPRAIEQYVNWMAQHTSQPWLSPEPVEVQQVESWEVYGVTEAYEFVPLNTPESYSVNAWFRDDWRPLSEEDLMRGLLLLEWSRADLLAVLQSVPGGLWDLKHPDERWSIAGIAGHIGGAEWWYLDRLDLAFDRSQLPKDPLERLGAVRSRMNAMLPTLTGQARVVGKDAELWSPRKLLRRAVWHERDHTQHIRQLLEKGQAYSA